MKPVTTDPPAALLDAFRKLEQPGQLGALLVEDGWDAEAMRVLSAWMTADVSWMQPKTPQPDAPRATARAWAWLRSGWDYDVNAIADTAGVARSTARTKLDMLIGGRLVYPDGTMHANLKTALNSHIASRLRGKKKKDGDKEKDAKDDKAAKGKETN